jgi:hypothetical protein
VLGQAMSGYRERLGPVQGLHLETTRLTLTVMPQETIQ